MPHVWISHPQEFGEPETAKCSVSNYAFLHNCFSDSDRPVREVNKIADQFQRLCANDGKGVRVGSHRADLRLAPLE